MPVTFEREDTARCFGTECSNQPAYRYITLTANGIVEGEQYGGVGVSLLCSECLVREHNLKELSGPISYGDKGLKGPSDIALLVLPLRLTKQQVAQLREEITESIPD